MLLFLIILLIALLAFIVAMFLEQEVIRFTKIPKANFAGNFMRNPQLYSSDPVEAEQHIAIQQEVHNTSNWESFYCNSFTGWRKYVYNYTYRLNVKKKAQRDAKVKARVLATSRKQAKEARRRKTRDLEKILHENKMQYGKSSS